MKYGLEYAGPARRVRRTWGRTVVDVLVLLAVAALVAWLLQVVRGAAEPVSSFRFQVSGLTLAMAPVPKVGDGAVLPAVLMGMGVLIWLVGVAERKLEEKMRDGAEGMRDEDCESEERWRRVRRKQRELLQQRAVESALRGKAEGSRMKAESDADTEIIKRLPTAEWGQQNGDLICEDEAELRWSEAAETVALGLEDLRRIVEALVVETCAARDLVGKAQRVIHEDSLAYEFTDEAMEKLHLCIGCLGGLRDAVKGQTAEWGQQNGDKDLEEGRARA